MTLFPQRHTLILWTGSFYQISPECLSLFAVKILHLWRNLEIFLNEIFMFHTCTISPTTNSWDSGHVSHHNDNLFFFLLCFFSCHPLHIFNVALMGILELWLALLKELTGEKSLQIDVLSLGLTRLLGLK